MAGELKRIGLLLLQGIHGTMLEERARTAARTIREAARALEGADLASLMSLLSVSGAVTRKQAERWRAVQLAVHQLIAAVGAAELEEEAGDATG